MKNIKIYNKLVRDKIPEIIKNSNRQYDSYIADTGKYQSKLHEKLLEEVNEFIEDPSIEELADILEVIDSIKEFYSFDNSDISKTKKEKFDKRGGFVKRIILEKVYDKVCDEVCDKNKKQTF